VKYKTQLSDADVRNLRKMLPPDLDVDEEVFADALRKTYKNLTLRPEAEHAAWLVYLDLVQHVPKATFAKLCLERSFFEVLQEHTTKAQATAFYLPRRTGE
jgi:hypothetical protein